jgi:hypothetical protein
MADLTAHDVDAPPRNVELSFTFNDGETVSVAVTGFTRSITAVKALIQAGTAPEGSDLAAAIRRAGMRPGNGFDLHLDYDGDTATVTVTGFRTASQLLDTLTQAASFDTVGPLLYALSESGDASLLELMDPA